MITVQGQPELQSEFKVTWATEYIQYQCGSGLQSESLSKKKRGGEKNRLTERKEEEKKEGKKEGIGIEREGKKEKAKQTGIRLPVKVL